MFIRVGRQILAWGETDVFRLLDNINPLDDSFGGFFIALDHRVFPVEPAARAAALAFSVAPHETEVLLYHSVDPELATEISTPPAGSEATRLEMGEGMVNELKEMGRRLGVTVVTEVSTEGTTGDNLVNRARENVDLIILGTQVRAGSSRLFLGSNVERLVTESPCSVIVLNV